jgi:sigma-E factor negative regulatory protein RseB
LPALALAAISLGPLQLSAADCESLPPRVEELLLSMANSAATLDFSGVVTLQRGADVQIVEISHGVTDGREDAVLARLTGQDILVRRVGHPVDCVHPGQLPQRAPHGAANGALCSLAANYRFSVQPGERIAGRETLRLRVEPRDMYRFGHLLDLDRESALVLRATTLAADQRVLEQYQFASLELHASPPAGSGAAEHLAAHPHPDAALPAGSAQAWTPGWLPAGFTATDAAPATSARKSYSDGLASFSVFLESLRAGLQPGEGVERFGSTVAYTRGTRLQGTPVLITVLGEVPVNTARMVADSVRLEQP